eukprot:TRINITY_DN15568_c0_g1_i1.p1 TRINITY_DN15568_c0_g1~~TRINITY_DN15568_c0_g1_i1.p1  ORF type:complete len:204 (+),score=16.69 TRINITY_DN15568_c0_g1_i1:73-612(+)
MRRTARAVASDFNNAVCITIPPDERVQMQELREEFDPSFRTWAVPHVKVLWPLGDEKEGRWDLLRARCKDISSFTVSFPELVMGEPGDGLSNLYCPASDESIPHFLSIQRAALSVFPEIPPTRPLTPSVHVGRCTRRELLDLKSMPWTPISFTVSRVTIFTRGADGMFRPNYQFPLSAA